MTLVGAFSSVDPEQNRSWVEACLHSLPDAAAGLLHQDESGSLVVGGAFSPGAIEPGEIGCSSSRGTLAVVAGRLTGSMSEARSLANSFERDGERTLADTQGRFVAALLDRKAAVLWLVRGICGQRPLFHASIPGGIAFASDLCLLLRHPRIPFQLNEVALADYLRCGVVWGSQTLAAGVQLVLPSHAIVFDAVRQRLSDCSYAAFPRGDEVPDDDDALVEIESALKSSLTEAASQGDGLALCLSAGRDSRTLMAMAHRAGIHLDYITNGLPGGIELELTRRMCQSLGETHLECLIGEDLIADAYDSARELAACTGGEGALSSVMMLYAGRRYRRDFGLRRVIRGHGGELTKLSDAYGFALPPAVSIGCDHEGAKEALLAQMSAAALAADPASALSPGCGALFQSATKASFAASYDALAVGSAAVGQVASLLFLTQYNGRHTVNAMRCMRRSVDVLQPFLDEEVVRAILRSPLSLRSGHAMQNALIERNCPKLLRIPESGLRVPMNASRIRRRGAELLSRVANRLGARSQDVPERWLAVRLRELVHEILAEESSLARTHVAADGLRSLIRRDRLGELDGRELLGRMAVVELFLRDVDRDPGGVRGHVAF